MRTEVEVTFTLRDSSGERKKKFSFFHNVPFTSREMWDAVLEDIRRIAIHKINKEMPGSVFVISRVVIFQTTVYEFQV